MAFLPFFNVAHAVIHKHVTLDEVLVLGVDDASRERKIANNPSFTLMNPRRRMAHWRRHEDDLEVTKEGVGTFVLIIARNLGAEPRLSP
jgi:hypothetical protein